MISRIINYIKNNTNSEYIQLKKLSRYPRYSSGNFSFQNGNINFPDSNAFVFMYREIFKKEIYRFDTENETPLIIDGGANIGLSTIYFKQLYPKAKILAFEPDKKIFDCLKNNILDFNLADIELKNIALWNFDGQISFNSEGSDANRIESSNNDTDFSDTYSVECSKLSNYLKDVKVDFLKLDIEGAEHEVIEEIVPYLDNIDKIFLEYHSFENRDQDLDKLLQILKNANFRLYINSPVSGRNSPFISEKNWLGIEYFLNIYAYRN
jgi:FkbM family methyltransferase